MIFPAKYSMAEQMRQKRVEEDTNQLDSLDREYRRKKLFADTLTIEATVEDLEKRRAEEDFDRQNMAVTIKGNDEDKRKFVNARLLSARQRMQNTGYKSPNSNNMFKPGSPTPNFKTLSQMDAANGYKGLTFK